MGTKILTLSDVETPAVYNSRIRSRFGEAELAIACGDLPSYYLEYVISMLNIRLYYVNGNHVQKADSEENAERYEHPWGAINLHRKVIFDEEHDLILAGIEGSLRYSRGPHQYTQAEMWKMVMGLVPELLHNKVRYGRYMDIFVSHASAAGIQDDTDPAHKGVQAFRWLLSTFQPGYHLHGHMHHYNPLRPNLSHFGSTTVVNTYGYREIEFQRPATPD
ncbi:MAG: hypothetical protein VB108_08670 [Anaerolineaceae bacterium]|nr:hypothetical protein [Anaerolineaceae bacterium]